MITRKNVKNHIAILNTSKSFRHFRGTQFGNPCHRDTSLNVLIAVSGKDS